MGTNEQKLKMLHLARLFHERTDEESGLTMPEIIQALEERGISAERKSIYRDISALQDFGMQIDRIPGRPVSYALVKRTFSKTELTLLVDAVQNSKFLSVRKADQLVSSLKKLTSTRHAKKLTKRVHVDGRIKTQDESVYSHVDVIQEALAEGRMIDFTYFKYNARLERVAQRGGKRYVLAPVHLIYHDNFYYLVTYSEKHDDFANYRVDRMSSLKISDRKIPKNAKIASFDAPTYQKSSFGMYGGPAFNVTLLASEEAIGGIVDRFGRGIAATLVPRAQIDALGLASERPWVRFTVPIAVSPPFYSWVAQFGTSVMIESPGDVARSYAEYLEGIASAQRATTSKPAKGAS